MSETLALVRQARAEVVKATQAMVDTEQALIAAERAAESVSDLRVKQPIRAPRKEK